MIVIGEHRPFTQRQKNAIENFCSCYNVAVYVNHLSNYHGKYSMQGNLLVSSGALHLLKPNLLITIGGQTGDYPFYRTFSKTQYQFEHWSINESGNVADTYDKLTSIYQMGLKDFFLSAVSSSSLVN